MPTYQSNITYRGGFYNNSVVNGVNTHVYSAKDMRKPYDVVFSDGIRPDADGTAGEELRVVKNGDLGITVKKGYAKLGGAWFENYGEYNITLDAGESVDKYDCVIIRNDDSESVKKPSIYIKRQETIPTVNDLTREGDIYEICVAYIRIEAFATAFAETDLIDTREDGSLCNVMSGVGAMVVRTYRNTYFSETVGQRVIPIGISQYDKSRDDLTVIVNGRVFAEGDNYVIYSNSREVSLNIGLPVVGTRIDFEVRKNVNAHGAETVVQEVAELRKEMTAANKKVENIYYCNGVNDNIYISNIIKTFLSSSLYHSLKLTVVGHFGFAQMATGDGTSANPYKLFNFASNITSPKARAVIDFSECEEISIPAETGASTVIFAGANFEIRNANIYASNTSAGTIIRVFDTTTNDITARDCRFMIAGYQDSRIAQTGLFENCYGMVMNVINNSYCFLPSNAGLLRVNGGEYYAYTGNSASFSAVVGQSEAEAVSILNGINAPTLAQGGYYQTNSIIQFTDGGVLRCTDLVSALPVTVTAGISEIRGTIEKSKPNLM